MIRIRAPHEDFDPDARFEDCREAVENVLRRFFSDAESKGWQLAEVALALADAAENYVMRLAETPAVKQ